jgi:ferredoxin-NADP reductase
MIERAQSDGNASAFQPGEDKQIVEFLAATQSPDAVNRRKAQAIAASSAGQSVVIPKTAAAVAPISRNGFLNYKTAVFPAIGCAVMAVLIVRRPSRSSGTTSANGSAPVAGTASIQPVSSGAGNAMLLQLVRITEQTHDSKTLRFAVMGNQRPTARPGQFVTFSFLFDGKKVIRSYSICSSPLVSGYIEITPKRVAKGCASVFLNDRAAPGMMVEASGPYGQFCFDEDKHQRVVFIAAGSGITPIMAMLRYMDDLNLPTRVTLLYCSRTERDIIFQKELAGLEMRLKNFDYRVLLSQPSAEWKGERGHINWSFVKSAVKEPGECDHFICGPAPFMDSTRRILGTLGVAPERIIQESFGNSTAPAPRPAAAVEANSSVEFVKSGKTCSVRQGQTILQTAEEQGVAIRFGCRQGQCGTCKTKLVAGNVTMDAEQGLSPEAKAQGFVLVCVGHANGNVKLDA